jgi:hypothetical protein
MKILLYRLYLKYQKMSVVGLNKALICTMLKYLRQ